MKNKIINFLILLLIILVTIFLFSACQKQKKTERIEPLVDSYLEMWNTGNLIAIDSIVTQNFELRIVPSFKPITGIDSLRNLILNTRKMFPDFIIQIEQQIFMGDTSVISVWTIEGTYAGEYNLPIEAKKMSVPGFSVLFFSGDKITGQWIAYSDLTLMKQLGFTLVPPQGSKK